MPVTFATTVLSSPRRQRRGRIEAPFAARCSNTTTFVLLDDSVEAELKHAPLRRQRHVRRAVLLDDSVEAELKLAWKGGRAGAGSTVLLDDSVEAELKPLRRELAGRRRAAFSSTTASRPN